MPRSPRSTASPSRVHLSIVVPLFNEAATIAELHRRLNAVLLLLGSHLLPACNCPDERLGRHQNFSLVGSPDGLHDLVCRRRCI